MVQSHGRLDNYIQFQLLYFCTQICQNNFGNFELLNQEIQSYQTLLMKTFKNIWDYYVQDGCIHTRRICFTKSSSKVVNSAQGLSCKLKFVHVHTRMIYLAKYSYLSLSWLCQNEIKICTFFGSQPVTKKLPKIDEQNSGKLVYRTWYNIVALILIWLMLPKMEKVAKNTKIVTLKLNFEAQNIHIQLLLKPSNKPWV
jgi:hypothetical protein